MKINVCSFDDDIYVGHSSYSDSTGTIVLFVLTDVRLNSITIVAAEEERDESDIETVWLVGRQQHRRLVCRVSCVWIFEFV